MKARFAYLVALLLLLIGCGDDGVQKDVILPQTPVLSARESWGVAARPYVRVYSGSGANNAIVGHLRSGVIAEITGRIVSPVGDGSDDWVQIRREDLAGWVRRPEVGLYDTRERAENAARAIRGD